MDRPSSPSAALLAAQERLLALRARLPQREQPPPATSAERPRAWERPSLLAAGQALLLERRRREAFEQGIRASDALRTAVGDEKISLQEQAAPALYSLPEKAAAGRTNSDLENPVEQGGELVKIYPDLALAMLQEGMETAGRIYWLLKYIDGQGRGWLTVEEVRRQLTRKKSALRVCGWRRLRQILNEGEGIFWRRDYLGRIWLAGAARTAQKLELARLTGRPVDLPVASLLGGIQQVRAHFYASFHSGRRTHNPISRACLREITGVPERTQLDYDKAAGVDRQQNLAIGELHYKTTMEQRAWQHGRGAFCFFDTNGQQGPARRAYVAWHLPNSYTGPHQQRAKGRQKKINRQLGDLVTIRAQGNGRERVEKIFWPHGAAAGRAYTQDQARDAYWPQEGREKRPLALWHVLSGDIE